MKKMYIALTAALLVFSGCIKETFPSDYVLGNQIAQSESALNGMVNAIYTTMAGYKNGCDRRDDRADAACAVV